MPMSAVKNDALSPVNKIKIKVNKKTTKLKLVNFKSFFKKKYKTQ